MSSSTPPPVNPGAVNLTFNGTRIAVPKGTLLVEAAKVIGVEVPVFCYHPKLKPVGACRMCLVEIEKNPRLQTACSTPAAEGMVVNSVSPNAVAGQNAVLELLLANHPLDCPICDKGGECPLQDNTYKFGLGSSRMQEDKRSKDKAYALSDRIVLDRERCIMCYRCTRFQAEIAGDQALVALERGGDSEIGTQTGEPFESPFSGNTIELCPVGALTSRFYRFRARPWDLVRTPSVCNGCSVGCNTSLHARDGAILRLVARENKDVDDGWLCDHGRFQTLPPVTAPGQVPAGEPAMRRPLLPLLRQGGRLLPATLDQALLRAAELLADQAGGQCGVQAAPTLSNAAIIALDRALRPALCGGRIGFQPSVHTPWLVQGRIANLPNCKKAVLLGLDPWTELPVLALWLRKAAVAGGSVVAVGPKNGLFRDTAAWLQVAAGKVRPALAQLLAALDGKGDDAAVIAAAGKLQRDGAAAVLLHPDLAADAETLAMAQQLGKRLGADAATGLLGAPAFGANARGAQELAPALASHAVATAGLRALLLLGVETLPPAGTARLIVASSRAVPDRDDVEVVLPLAHSYESQGTFTNLEGQQQTFAAGGFAGRHVVADHVLIGSLAAALARDLQRSR